MNQYACGAGSFGDFTTIRCGWECSNFSSQLIGYGLGLGYSARASTSTETEMMANAARKTPITDMAKAYGFIGVLISTHVRQSGRDVRWSHPLPRMRIVVAIIVKRRCRGCQISAAPARGATGLS